jgi:hypothetical protein
MLRKIIIELAKFIFRYLNFQRWKKNNLLQPLQLMQPEKDHLRNVGNG